MGGIANLIFLGFFFGATLLIYVGVGDGSKKAVLWRWLTSLGFVGLMVFAVSVAMDWGLILWLIVDSFLVAPWLAILALHYGLKKWLKGKVAWLPRTVLALLLISHAYEFLVLGRGSVEQLVADFKPDWAYKCEFDVWPSKDVSDIRSLRDNTFLGITHVVLQFHASRETFDRIRPRSLKPVSNGRLFHDYARGWDGYIQWAMRYRFPIEKTVTLGKGGREMWATTDEVMKAGAIVMIYDASDGEVEYYFSETE